MGASVPTRSWKSDKLSWVLVSIRWKINKQKTPNNNKTPIIIKIPRPAQGRSARQMFWAESCSYPTLFLVGAACAGYFVLISAENVRAQELCESQGGCPGLSVLTSLMVSVDVKQH